MLAAQLKFQLNEQTDPTRLGAHHYAPVLQCKSGEMQALSKVPSKDRDRLTPIIRVVGPKDQGSPLTPGRVRGWVNSFAPAVLKHPFFLDTLRVSPCRPVQMTRRQIPLITYLHQQARRRQLEFIPVIDIAQCRSQELTHSIAQSIHEDQRGLCLRFPSDTIVPHGTSLQTKFESAFARLGVCAAGFATEPRSRRLWRFCGTQRLRHALAAQAAADHGHLQCVDRPG